MAELVHRDDTEGVHVERQQTGDVSARDVTGRLHRLVQWRPGARLTQPAGPEGRAKDQLQVTGHDTYTVTYILHSVVQRRPAARLTQPAGPEGGHRGQLQVTTSGPVQWR